MQLTSRFRVPVPLDQAWEEFTHLDRLAPCFPGATLDPEDGDGHRSSLAVKLGPLPVLYAGQVGYRERDVGRRRLVVRAEGEDERGHGTAAATVTMHLQDRGPETEVEVVTELALTGGAARYGDAVVTATADRLLDQFASCLAARLADPAPAPASSPDHEPSSRERDQGPAVTEQTPTPADPADGSPTAPLPVATAAPAVDPGGPGTAPVALPPRLMFEEEEPLVPRRYVYREPQMQAKPHAEVLRDTLALAVNRHNLRRYGPGVAAALVLAWVTVKVVRR